MTMSIFSPSESYEPATTSPYKPPEKTVSAGRAWLMSLIAPGSGQIYCDASTRGAAWLVCFIVCVATAIFAPGNPRWIAIRVGLIVWVFAGIDAYLTAREVNYGMEGEAADNPRVAAFLNMTTNGFGYLYLSTKRGRSTSIRKPSVVARKHIRARCGPRSRRREFRSPCRSRSRRSHSLPTTLC